MLPNTVKDIIHQLIGQVVSSHGSTGSDALIWQPPLVGFARAADPLFRRLKQVAHPGHLLPSDLLEGASSVIVYFIPFQESITRGNAEGDSPSMGWAKAYQETNELITLINAEISTYLQSEGLQCSTIPPTHNFDPASLLSPWSHRHAAYIAGLGTLGLNRMLITEKGCAGRLGSLVTELELTPTIRAEQDYCLYLHDGSCSACIERCPCGALGFDDLDRHRCYARLCANEKELSLDGPADVCGKCCCGLPCSSRNPAG